MNRFAEARRVDLRANDDLRQAAPDPVLLTLEEAARRLNVPVSWLRGRVANRSIACTRLGRHVRFTHDQLVAIVEDAEQSAAEAPAVGLTRRSRARGIASR